MVPTVSTVPAITSVPEAYCTSTDAAPTEAKPPRPTDTAGPLVAGVAFTSNTVLPASATKPNDAPVIWAKTSVLAANRAVTLEPVATNWEPVLLKPTSPVRLTKSLTIADIPFSAKATVPDAMAPLNP